MVGRERRARPFAVPGKAGRGDAGKGRLVVERIISGGQTGADRAALDFAIACGIPHGGWVPRGRKTEAGRLPDRYALRELPSAAYWRRTERNVLAADGTLIVSHGRLTGGSALTRSFAERHERPWMHADLARKSVEAAGDAVRDWIEGNEIRVLNVARPRAGQDPGIYGDTLALLARACGTS
jgi:hypothetical protein